MQDGVQAAPTLLMFQQDGLHDLIVEPLTAQVVHARMDRFK